MRLHEGDGAHLHEMSVDALGAVRELIWKIDNVELTTVGIDIGSSTSHLMFSRVHLQRKTQQLSSQFVVVDRAVLWRSPILLTPFLSDNTIDAARLGAFVDESYRDAGIARNEVDTGAVILTGEAIKRTNAEAIADLFAADAGKFVCASAGHHLECVLAANGSGAVAMSRQQGSTVLNVDIGGGTTKLALIRNGEILGTCAIAVGGRLVAFDAAGRVVRVDESARHAARVHGIALVEGDRPAPASVDRIVDALADAVIALIRQESPVGLARDLLLIPDNIGAATPDAITFSGGVSEYIYAREQATYGDIAAMLAARVVQAFRTGRIVTPLCESAQGIRATVIGASQFSVQVSGKTIHVPERVALPVHNVPAISPAIDLAQEIDAAAVASSIAVALERADLDAGRAVAVALSWHGDPHYRRLRALAEGIALAFAGPPSDAPLVLMIDGDVGRTLGYILEHEVAIARDVVSIDGIRLREFDYVDLGAMIEPAHVVPVVIKSLLFAAGQQYLRRVQGASGLTSSKGPHHGH